VDVRELSFPFMQEPTEKLVLTSLGTRPSERGIGWGGSVPCTQNAGALLIGS